MIESKPLPFVMYKLQNWSEAWDWEAIHTRTMELAICYEVVSYRSSVLQRDNEKLRAINNKKFTMKTREPIWYPRGPFSLVVRSRNKLQPNSELNRVSSFKGN